MLAVEENTSSPQMVLFPAKPIAKMAAITHAENNCSIWSCVFFDILYL
jgi:hypothetical protein